VLGKGILYDYHMQFSVDTADGGKADIKECTKALTEGIIYKIPMEAVDYLYKREGVYTQKYRLAVVSVFFNETLYEVLTFIGNNKQPETAPTELYATEILRGAAGTLSDAYIQQIHDKISNLMSIKK